MSIRFDTYLKIGASSELAVDGSTPKKGEAGPATGKVWEVARAIVTIQDNGAFNTDEYGQLTKLTNGCVLRIEDTDDVVLDTLTDDAIKQNIDWGSYCYDVTYQDFGGNQAEKFLLVRWTFSKAGKPLVLNAGEKLVFLIQDNIAALTSHKVLTQGVEFDEDDYAADRASSVSIQNVEDLPW